MKNKNTTMSQQSQNPIGKQGNTYAWPLICLCTDFNESGKVKLGEHTVAGRDCYIYICLYTHTHNFEIKSTLR